MITQPEFLLTILIIIISILNLILWRRCDYLQKNNLQHMKMNNRYINIDWRERTATLDEFKNKYNTFPYIYNIHKWIEMWESMNFDDEKVKNSFLLSFEDSIVLFEKEYNIDN